jgi:N,N'-diacetyllegionaminate synthase
MRINEFDTDETVFVVAEIGNNHEGDFTLAQEMIGRAAEAGVDAVKFQTFIPELFISRADVDRIEQLRGFQLSYSQFEALARQADLAGVTFFSTPLDLESAHFLNSLQPLFKIASGDNTFLPLIETVASFRKPTIISTGLADFSLLDRLYAIFQEQDGMAELALLHCVASYPVPTDQANLGAIYSLRRRYPDITIGYSDHTIGIETAIFAVAAGARIVEKHFTLDKQYSDFRDHQLSADPEEMTKLVNAIRYVDSMIGSGEKMPQPCEQALQVAARRSIAVNRDLPANHELVWQDLCWVRPGSGMAVGQEKDVLGCRTKRIMQQGELIQSEDLL